MFTKLSNTDILALATALKTAYEPIIKHEVETALKEIPFHIREQIQRIAHEEIREQIRAAVEKQMYVKVGTIDVV